MRFVCTLKMAARLRIIRNGSQHGNGVIAPGIPGFMVQGPVLFLSSGTVAI